MTWLALSIAPSLVSWHDGAMIETAGLASSFGSVRALHPLTMSVARGSTVGLLGANGAGKTPTMNLLTTLLEPSEGTALIAGHDIRKDPLCVRRAIGYVLAAALPHDPQVLILDEPMSGLDVESQHVVASLALIAVSAAMLVPASRLGDFSGHGESPFRLGILFPVAGFFAGLPGAPLAMVILVVDLRSGAGRGATLSDVGLTLLLFELVVRILSQPAARPAPADR